jgi:hypothetical protein
MKGEADSMIARLKRLPLRLRLAHLAALIRCGRLIVRNGCLSYPPPTSVSEWWGGSTRMK